MSIELDHALVSVRDKRAAAELLAYLLGVPWGESGTGRFTPVYVNDGLTLDFDEADDSLPVQHFCFRVSEDEFDGILARNIYWEEPEGVVWEILTVSYARQP